MKELYVTLHTKQDKSPVTIENSILRECRKYASVIRYKKANIQGWRTVLGNWLLCICAMAIH